MATIRVHDLAKEFGMTSKELLLHLSSFGISAKGASSPLNDAEVAFIRNKLEPIIAVRMEEESRAAERRREQERSEEARRFEEEQRRVAELRRELQKEKDLRELRDSITRAAEEAVDEERKRWRQEQVSASPFASLLAQIAEQEALAEGKPLEKQEQVRLDDRYDGVEGGQIDELLQELWDGGFLIGEANIESLRGQVLSSLEASGLIEDEPRDASWEHYSVALASYHWRVTDAGCQRKIVQGTAEGDVLNRRLAISFPIFFGAGIQAVIDALKPMKVLTQDPTAELEHREEEKRRQKDEQRKRKESRRREDIKEKIQERGIETLYHFTSAENLASIFKHGILSRTALKEQGITADINDEKRLDSWYSGISLSVSWPNYQYFGNVRGRYPERTYVLLELDPSILYELDCSFYPTNAANKEMGRMKRQERRSAAAFEELFQDRDGYSREKYGTPAYFTTDPQAEVFAFDPIPAEYIRAVDFETRAESQPFEQDVPKDRLHFDKAYKFKYRPVDRFENGQSDDYLDYEFWQKKLEERDAKRKEDWRKRKEERERSWKQRHGIYDEYDDGAYGPYDED